MLEAFRACTLQLRPAPATAKKRPNQYALRLHGKYNKKMAQMYSIYPFDKKDQIAVARIIFMRLAGQIAGSSITEETWLDGLQGFRSNPELFPLIEACMDAAVEILRYNAAAHWRHDV